MIKKVLANKWLWISCGGAVALALLAGFVIAVNLEGIIKNNKDAIVAQMETAVGRDVSIGELEVSIWTGLGVRLNDFELADDPAFSQSAFVKADDLYVSLKFWPLLQSKIEVSRLALGKPEIHVIQNGAGAYNFASLAASGAETTPAPSESPIQISLAHLNIDDGRVVYSASGQDDVAIQRIGLEVLDFAMDKAFPVEFSAAVMEDNPNVLFAGKLGPLAGAQGIPNIEGNVKISPVAANAIQQLPGLASAISPEAKVDGTLQGEFDFKGSGDTLEVKGGVDLTKTGIAYAGLFEKPAGRPAKAHLEAKINSESVMLNAIKLDVDPAQIQGKGQVALGKTMAYKIALESNDIALDQAATLVAMLAEYNPGGNVSLKASIASGKSQPDIEAIAHLKDAKVEIVQLPRPVSNINGIIAYDGKKATSKNLSAKVGKSDVALEAETKSLSPLALAYKFSSPETSVQDVLFLEPTGKKPDVLRDVSGDGTLALDGQGVNLNGSLRSSDGAFYGMDFKSLKGDYTLKNMVATIPNLTVQTLDGLVKGKAVYDMSGESPTFDFTAEIQEIDVVEYLRSSVVSLPEFLEGRLNMNLSLAGSGAAWEAIQPTLTGKGNVEVLDGMFMNMNIGDSVLGGLTKIPGASNFLGQDLKTQYPALFNSQHTMFENLKMAADIQNGKIDFGTLLVKATDWAVNGKGVYDLAAGLQSDGVLKLSQGLSNYLVGKADFMKYLTDQQGSVVVPFSMNGMLPNITPAPRSDMVSQLLQKAVMGKVVDNLTGGKGNSFADLLGGFGGLAPGGKPAAPSAPQSETQPKAETPGALPATAAPQTATKTEIEPAKAASKIFKGLLDGLKK